MDLVVSSVIGAVIASIATAGATWWVSIRLDRQRENRQLSAAVGVVSAEIKENVRRLARANCDLKDLTMGDWGKNKATLAALALRANDHLWERVVELYGEIFEAQQGRAEPPTPEHLQSLVGLLAAEQSHLEREIKGFRSLGRTK